MKAAILGCATLLLNACQDKGADDPKRPVVELNKPTMNLQVGDSERLIATLMPEGGGEDYTWTSDNQAVATVVDGIVTAIAPGEAVIRATSGELSAQYIVSVNGAPRSETTPPTAHGATAAWSASSLTGSTRYGQTKNQLQLLKKP